MLSHANFYNFSINLVLEKVFGLSGSLGKGIKHGVEVALIFGANLKNIYILANFSFLAKFGSRAFIRGSYLFLNFFAKFFDPKANLKSTAVEPSTSAPTHNTG